MPSRPRDWHGYLGNRKKISYLKRLCDGCRKRGEPLFNILIRGCPGIGKTRLARSIAKAVRGDYFPVDASGDLSIDAVRDLVQRLNTGDVFHIDEAHAMGRKLQDLLLGIAGEDKMLKRDDMPIGKKKADNFISVSSFTLILTTNLPSQLSQALRSRMGMEVFLEPYRIEDMREIVHRIVTRKGLRVKNHVLTHFARASRGIPRRAEHLIGQAYLFFPEPDRVLTTSDFHSLMDKIDYYMDDEVVLNEQEQKYLTSLLKYEKPVLISQLVKDAKSERQLLFDEVEYLLFKDGLVQAEPRGRVLTPKGREVARRLPGFDTDNDIEMEVQ